MSEHFKKNQAVNVFNNVILARNRQLPDDDRMIETCRSILKGLIFFLFIFLLFNSKLHRRLHVITPSLWRVISYLFL